MSGDQRVSLLYARHDDRFREEKPYVIASHMPKLKDCDMTNIPFSLVSSELIRDLRGRESEFTLDDHGFQIIKHKFATFNPALTDSVEATLLPEAERFLKANVKNRSRNHFFDYRWRTVDHEEKFVEIDDRTQPLVPIEVVHIDQSGEGARKRVLKEMGDDAPCLLRGRIRLINIWFPLDNPVQNDALAVCDGSTISPEDMIIADHVTRGYVGETVYPVHTESLKWYYLSAQRPDEAFVFKIYDSDESVSARWTPHVSVKLPDALICSKPRVSFEIRALVF